MEKHNSLVLSDFDGTITNRDSLICFIRYAVGAIKLVIGLFATSPYLVMYKLKLIPNYKAKQILLSWFFNKFSAEHFNAVASSYSLNEIDKILRPGAMDQLNMHKSKGHTVVIVSASIDSVLRPWCEKNGFELIATKLEVKDSMITGNMSTHNCYGQEKVNKITEKYDLKQYDHIFAYGDSKGDIPMLNLAQDQVYKPFR